MAASLGEITSVEFDHEGKYLLAGCKDNSNRLWDLRMVCGVSRGVESVLVLLTLEATESVSVYGASEHVEESHSVRLCARLVNHRRRI
jgi:WD40 repeat protein